MIQVNLGRRSNTPPIKVHRGFPNTPNHTSWHTAESSHASFAPDFKGAYSLDGSVYIALEAMDGSLVDLISPHQVHSRRAVADFFQKVVKS